MWCSILNSHITVHQATKLIRCIKPYDAWYNVLHTFLEWMIKILWVNYLSVASNNFVHICRDVNSLVRVFKEISNIDPPPPNQPMMIP